MYGTRDTSQAGGDEDVVTVGSGTRWEGTQVCVGRGRVFTGDWCESDESFLVDSHGG